MFVSIWGGAGAMFDDKFVYINIFVVVCFVLFVCFVVSGGGGVVVVVVLFVF